MKKWALMYDLVYADRNKWKGNDGIPLLRNDPNELLQDFKELKSAPMYVANVKIVEMTFHGDDFFDSFPEVLI